METHTDNGNGNDNGNDASQTVDDPGRRSTLKTLGIAGGAVTGTLLFSTQEADAHYDRFNAEDTPGNYWAEGSRRKTFGPIVLKYGHTIGYKLESAGSRQVRVTVSHKGIAVKRQKFTVSGTGTFTIWSRRNGHEIKVERV